MIGIIVGSFMFVVPYTFLSKLFVLIESYAGVGDIVV